VSCSSLVGVYDTYGDRSRAVHHVRLAPHAASLAFIISSLAIEFAVVNCPLLLCYCSTSTGRSEGRL